MKGLDITTVHCNYYNEETRISGVWKQETGGFDTELLEPRDMLFYFKLIT